MEAVEEFILKHADLPYDPAKAHEYYLRTRKLKGRQRALMVPNKGRVAAKTILPKKVKTTAQRQKEVEARVKALEVRLNKLRAVLKELLNKAEGRTVLGANNKPPTKSTSSAGSKKLTSAQKQEAAKKSKEYYEKHKKEVSLAEKEKKLEQSIKEVKVKIEKARKDLKASIERARKVASQKNQRAALRASILRAESQKTSSQKGPANRQQRAAATLRKE